MLTLVLQLLVPPAGLAQSQAGETTQPVAAPKKSETKTPEGQSTSGWFPEKTLGWRSVGQVGLWWNSFNATLNGAPYSHPGLLSLAAGLGGDYHFEAPIYLGFAADLYTPQILWKSAGLGVFYFFCFFFTAGKCTANIPFATGERDAGYVDLGGHVGTRIPGIPLRVYAGPEMGIFFSGLTPFPMSALMVKMGLGFDISQKVALSLQLKRSVLLAQWNFDLPTNLSQPGAWILDLNLQIW